jgi:hypothetical protein
MSGTGQHPGRNRFALAPEIVEPHGISPRGLATTDTDDLKTFRAGLEGPGYRRRHAQHVPHLEFDDLVIELGTARPSDHYVSLVLHTVR